MFVYIIKTEYVLHTYNNEIIWNSLKEHENRDEEINKQTKKWKMNERNHEKGKKKLEKLKYN